MFCSAIETKSLFIQTRLQIIGFRYNTHNISLTLHNNEKVIDSLTLCSSPQHSPSTIVQLLAFQIKLKNLSLSWDGRERRHWTTREQYWFFILYMVFILCDGCLCFNLALRSSFFSLFLFFRDLRAISLEHDQLAVFGFFSHSLTWYSIIFQFKEENISRGSHGPGVLIFSPLFAKVSSPMLSCFAYFSFCFQFFQFNRGSSHREEIWASIRSSLLSHGELDRQC